VYSAEESEGLGSFEYVIMLNEIEGGKARIYRCCSSGCSWAVDNAFVDINKSGQRYEDAL
jgi:hypothetical protein